MVLELRRDRLNVNAQPAARDLTLLDELLHYPLRHVYRNSETDTHEPAGAGCDRGVYADNFAVEVHQGPAGIPGIDGGIGLDEVLVVRQAHVRPTARGNNARGHGILELERVPHGKYPLADLDPIGVPQLRRREVLTFDLYHGEVRARVRSYDLGFVFVTFARRNRYFVGALDDVVVREYVAILAQDDARARTLAGILLAFGPFEGLSERALAEEIEGESERRVRRFRTFFYRVGNSYVDYGRRNLLDYLGEPLAYAPQSLEVAGGLRRGPAPGR